MVIQGFSIFQCRSNLLRLFSAASSPLSPFSLIGKKQQTEEHYTCHTSPESHDESKLTKSNIKYIIELLNICGNILQVLRGSANLA